MEWNELFIKMQEINTTINNDCDLRYLEENMQFVLNIGKYYDECLNNRDYKTNEIIECYNFFTKYFLIYMAKKYNKSFKYETVSNTEDTFYRLSDNSINLSKYSIGKDFQIILFKIFHEFRHKMQWDDIIQKGNINTVNNILEIDPATIIFLKEQFMMNNNNFYRGNHDCFIMEHDANLFSISECKVFFRTDFIEKVYSGELTNYIKSMIDGIDLSVQEYHSKQSLPIIYEEDYRFKKHILGKQIPSKSLLSLIYNLDGKSKTYEELMKEKIKLLEKYKDTVIDRKTSTTNYEQWSNPKRAEEHIEEIFKLIIASDPILTLQEYLYKLNTIDNRLIAKQYSDRIVSLLDNCPQLVDIYSKEITDILRGEIFNGNVELVQGIINNFPDKEITREIQSIITVMNMNVVGKKAPTTNGNNSYEERTQEEQQIATGQKKTSKFRPIIREAVKKLVIQHDEKQKLHEMKEQLLDYQEQSMRQQDKYEEEESHGMSM